MGVTAHRDAPQRATLARPVVATAEIVAMSAVAHAGAGGSLPSADLLLASTLVTGAVCWALRLRLLRLGVAAALATAGQLALHTAATATASTSTVHADHLHGAAAATGGSGVEMLLAHLVSGLVTVLALIRQEQALLVVARTLLPTATAVPTHVAPPRPGTDHVVRHVPVLAVEVAPRRGPPLPLASARP